MKAKPVIKIDIISDIVCPWCYIGKRRLEKAAVHLSGDYDFEMVYHPFELNPYMPVSGVNQMDHLSEKFGGEEQYKLITERTTSVAAQEGLIFNFEKQRVSPNTRKAHALIQLAKEENKQSELVEAFFKAYFTDGVDLSKDDNLIDIAIAVGLDKETAATIISSQRLLENIAGQETEIQKLGIRGVPFYIIDNQFGISGAQTSETFVTALRETAGKRAGETCDISSTNC